MNESTKTINKLMADISKIPVSKLTVKVFYDAKSRSSFCWRHFGNLLLKEGSKKKIINSDQVYCSVCLDFVKAESEDVTLGSVKIKYYNMTVSTGNLTRHLRDSHQIFEIKELETRTDSHPPSRQLRKVSVNTRVTAQDQFELAKDLAILCCRSLIPFDAVCHEAMGDFLIKYKVVRPEDLPTQRTVSGEALTHVYDVTANNVRNSIIMQDNPRHGAMSLELWTDEYRKLDYVMFSLHYLTNEFELKSFNLSTSIITGETTNEKAERLKRIIEDVEEMFGLTDKNIHAVTTAGAVENRAASLLNMPQHLCLGLGLQNLLSDGINEVQEIKQLVTKFVAIIKIIVYRINDMEAEDEAEQELLDSLCEVVDGLHHELDLIEDENRTSPIIETPCLNPLEDTPAGITEIKKEPTVYIQEETADSCPKSPSIHWNNILKMAEKLLLHTPRNQVIINNILIRLAQEEIMITPSEWVLLEELAKILTRFREAVTIISSQICTLNVALVFRSEIIDILNTNNDDESIFMFRFKRSMLSNINKRFPVSRAMVAAALLDCRFMALKEVDSYLESEKTTRAAFLASFIKECIIDDEIPDIKPKTSPSSTSSSHDSSILMKLSQKHRGASLTLQDDPIEQECWRYLASADPKDPKDGDLLSFWKKRQDTFPWLSAFAKAILCIPATSTPCDNVFYGNSLAAKRSRVNPTHMNKVIFVHTNYKHFEQTSNDTNTIQSQT